MVTERWATLAISANPCSGMDKVRSGGAKPAAFKRLFLKGIRLLQFGIPVYICIASPPRKFQEKD